MKNTNRSRMFFALLLIIPLGFYTKFYEGPGNVWVHKYGGDICYPMFWIFVILLCKPNANAIKAGAIVFFFSTLIEFSQLLSHPALDEIRRTFIGRTLIGTDFESIDIFYYLLGSCGAVLLNKLIHHAAFPLSQRGKDEL